MADGAGSASGLEEKLAGLSTGSSGGGDKQNPPPAGEGGEEPQLSKNAKKREEKRKKLEEERRLKEGEKKNKAAAAAACGTTQRASAADDDDMDPTQYYENRLKTLDSLKTAGVNPYPHKFPVGISVPKYIEKYKSLSDGGRLDVTECLAAERPDGMDVKRGELAFHGSYCECTAAVLDMLLGRSYLRITL